MAKAQESNVIDFADVALRAQTRRAEIAAAQVDKPKGVRSLYGAERELEAVLENIEYGVYFMGPDFRVRLMNSAFRHMWEVEDAFIAGEPDFFETLEYLRERGAYDVPDDEWPDYVKARFEAVRTADGVQRESRRADGKVFLYKCLALPDDGRMLVYFDITEQKATEKELEASTAALEERVSELENLRGRMQKQRDAAVRIAEEITESRELLTEAIENIDEAILVWDEAGSLMACNQRIHFMYPDLADIFQVGVQFEEVIRKGTERGVFIAPEGGTAEDLIADWRDKHEGGRAVEQRKLPDGRWLRVNWRITRRGKRVVTITDITRDKESEANIMALAARDSLTGLANRRAFDQTIAKLSTGSRDDGEAAPVGLLLIDLDEFKDVNDTYGHPAGDAVLKAVAERIGRCVRKSDMAARIGGDEFAVVLRGVPDKAPMERLSERILEAMREPVAITDGSLACTVSIGGAHCGADDCAVEDLAGLADKALYAAKEAGRDQACLYLESPEGE